MNKFFKDLGNGAPKFGLGIMYSCSGVVERIGKDWDWIWIDFQHGQFAYRDVLEVVRVCGFINIPVVIRLASQEYGEIGTSLDMAPDAIMVPMVETAEQAKKIVRAAKFHPVGKRSYGGRRPIDLYGINYSGNESQQPFLVCQIESHEGLDNAEAIGSIDGVDGLFLGSDDIAVADGLRLYHNNQ